LRSGGDISQELLAAVADHPAKLLVTGPTKSGAGRWLAGRVPERVAEAAQVPVLVVRRPGPLLSWLSGKETVCALCGVDFTQSSDAALGFVRELCGIRRLEVEAAHVVEEKSSRLTALVSGSSRHDWTGESTVTNTEADIRERICGVLGEPPYKIHVPRVARHADRELARLAEERDAGLVVVGTHLRHGWQRLKAHPFPRGVVAHAATNVLCVPAGAAEMDLRTPRIRRVLVATDLNSTGNNPLRYALGLMPSGGEVRVIHVIHAAASSINPLSRSITAFGNRMVADKARAEAQAILESVIAAFPHDGNVHFTAEAIVHEHTAEAICGAADQFGADVICMGTRGHSRAGVAVMGSVMQAVSAKSQRPVFVFPAVS
jgi:nucleotide-binding universal stress UspA family protein